MMTKLKHFLSIIFKSIFTIFCAVLLLGLGLYYHNREIIAFLAIALFTLCSLNLYMRRKAPESADPLDKILLVYTPVYSLLTIFTIIASLRVLFLMGIIENS